MQQEIRFCNAPDGVRIAYAVAGSGPPLVKAANWLNHLEFDWQSPLWRHLFEDLASCCTLVRYDERGNGLSDWNVADLSFESFVSDLETVVDAAGLERFPLLGISQGGAVAIAYAVRNPERVSHLIILGAYAKGWSARNDPADAQKREAMITLIQQGWGQDNPAFRQMWSTLYIPDGTREQVDWFNELQRISTSPENAVRLLRAVGAIDVASLLPRVQAPTLVLHCRGDAAVPFEAGRAMAARIPGARFVELPGNNHLLLDGTPAWSRFRDEVHAFLGGVQRSRAASSDATGARAPSGSGESTRSAARWLPGTELAHYRIAAALGAGGMGVVYRARDTRLDRDVALKVLPEAMVADPTARARLVREARTASALNHPNICHIYEVGEAGGHSYIAMEHIEGRPLSQSIPAEGLPLESLLRYVGQLAEALAHAHDRGVLHRDLKSANVMLTSEGRVKVLDFGLAKRAATDSDAATCTIDSVTQAGAVAGTLHYLAPEVLRGQPADARSDLWALGVILYEMSTGKLPFTGTTGFEASAAILREPPAPLPAHVPAGLRAIISRCLAKEPARRYQRAGELRAALEAISSDTAAAPVSPAPTVPLAAPAAASSATVPALLAEEPRPRRWLLWLGAALLLVSGFLVWDNFFSPHARQPVRPEETGVASPGSAPSAPAGPRLSTGGKPSPNAEANAYYERGINFLVTRYELAPAIQMFRKALELDPKFAEARAWYAFALMLQVDGGHSNDTKWLYEAERELQRAAADDPECGRVHSALAGVYFHQGRKELVPAAVQKALALNPEDFDAQAQMMLYHGRNGDYEQEKAIAFRLIEQRSLFWVAYRHLAEIHRVQGDYAGAHAALQKVIDQDPTNVSAAKTLTRIALETDDLRGARKILQGMSPADRANYISRLSLALLLAAEGKRRDALRQMNADLLKFADTNKFFTLEAAEFYALLGDGDKALEWLDRAVRYGDERADWFQRDPLLASIRNHPRFRQILDAIAFRRQQKQQ